MDNIGSWLKPLKILNDDLKIYADTIWRDLNSKRIFKIDGVVTILNIPHFSAVEISTNKQCFLHADWMFLYFYEKVKDDASKETGDSKFNSAA